MPVIDEHEHCIDRRGLAPDVRETVGEHIVCEQLSRSCAGTVSGHHDSFGIADTAKLQSLLPHGRVVGV